MLNEDFQNVLDEYLKAREENGYINAPIAHHIQQTLKNEVRDLIEDSAYKITASAGVGRLSEIPWIGAFKPENTNNISSGYLFKADMTGVYLVLRAFNYAELEERYGIFVPQHLRTKAIHIKALLEDSPFDIDYFDEVFDLNSKSKTADIHKSGMILCKLYEKDNIPSDEILIKDLKQVIEIQDYVYDNYSDNMYLTVDEWIAALEDENLIDNKTLNILEINYNFEYHTASYDDIIKKREELGYPNEKTYTMNIVNTSKRLKERFNKTEIYGADENEIWVPRFFYGARRKNPNGKRVFYNTLREELVEALEKYDKSKRPDRIEIDMVPYLTSQENKVDSESIQYWLIAAGENSVWWEDFQQNNEIGINFPGTKDINLYENPDEIIRDLQEANNNYDHNFSNIAKECWQFAHDMQIGDVVFVRHGVSKIIGRGIIESDYQYDDSKPYPKFRKINWTHKGNWDYDGTFSYITLNEVTHKPYLDTIKKLFEEKQYDSFSDYLMDKRYYFSSKTIENYLLSLKVKPFVILTGNSGTGKTKLSQLFADYLTLKQNPKYTNHAIVPVGANWTENRNIVGYFNVLTKSYQHTQSLDLLLDAKKDLIHPYFLILDEMNLSHVERYFSDFLSAMESNEAIPLHNAISKDIGVPNELKLPENVYIIGTVNVDETTYMFSPKVLDRTNVLEFKTFDELSIIDYINNTPPEVKFKGDVDYLMDVQSDPGLRENILSLINDEFYEVKCEIKTVGFENEVEENEQENTETTSVNVLDEIINILTKINGYLKGSGFEFGYRTVNEILAFMYVAWKYENLENQWKNWRRYLDAQILQKILPKLHGSQMVLGETLDNLLTYCLGIDSIDDIPEVEDIDDNYPYPDSSKKLIKMKEILEKQRYVSFIN